MNKLNELLAQYLHNELSETDKTLFEKELEKNPELQNELEELQGVDAFLKQSLPTEFEETLDDDAHTAILHAATKGDVRIAIQDVVAKSKPSKRTMKSKVLLFLITTGSLAAACCVVFLSSPALVDELKVPFINVMVLESGESEVRLKDLPPPPPEEPPILEEILIEIDMPQVDIEAPPATFDVQSPQPREMNAVALSPSLVVMKNIMGSRSSRTRKAPIGRFGRARRSDELNAEAYDHVAENDFINVADEAYSTFSIDVDTASYSNVRRLLNQGQLPPKGAVRVEEMINYFKYNYATPKDEKPFAVHLDVSTSPWNENAKLVRIGLKGREVDRGERPQANLVFLIDVSGSMYSSNKLPLLKRAMKLLLNNLNEKDHVSIVVYAGTSRIVLASTPCSEKSLIENAIDGLQAEGSTNGEAGIDLAYRIAVGHFIEGGINRVILCSDGDFNVGETSNSALIEQIQKNAKTGIFLSVMGFGMGNYKDATLEKLANKGNGMYGYIDTFDEAKKVFGEQINGTLLTIAKDVKIQVEFNPQQVSSYRLIGYENRKLDKQDFNDDKKDAGEIGAGHTVTALYELIPVGAENENAKVDDLRYQLKTKTDDALAGEIMNVKIRYKAPDEDKSQLLEFPLKGHLAEIKSSNEDMNLAVAVATFGMILTDSEYKGDADYDSVLELAKDLNRKDEKEFIKLVKAAQRLAIMED